MERSSKIHLPKTPFRYQQAVEAGATQYALRKLLSQGALERLGRDLYQLANLNDEGPEGQYQQAALRCGVPSAICLLSALEHHGLTDEITRQTWVLVPAQKRVAAKNIKLVRSRAPHWDVGIHKEKHYWVTTLERTLVDCLRYKRLIGSAVALVAIKRALVQKKVKLGDLYDMAKKLQVEHRLRPYIEALAA